MYHFFCIFTTFISCFLLLSNPYSKIFLFTWCRFPTHCRVLPDKLFDHHSESRQNCIFFTTTLSIMEMDNIHESRKNCCYFYKNYVLLCKSENCPETCFNVLFSRAFSTGIFSLKNLLKNLFI